MDHLSPDRVLADKDEEDEAAPEEVDTANDPEEELCVGATVHIPMVPMQQVVNTLKYPENTHHSEQLGEQQLKYCQQIQPVSQTVQTNK